MLAKTHSKVVFSLFFASLYSLGAFASSLSESISRKSLDELVSTSDYQDTQMNYPEAEELLWSKYQKAVREDSERRQEVSDKQIRYGDKVMRFSMEKRGVPGPNGYPLYIAFHGGGTAPKELNDSQWNAMKRYYLDSVDNGIYVATRGVTDTWNLHFVDESYPLYDHLITNLIALENVDPNQVYLTGFSAGGDGVYQVTPRMADRWAAANMSAGHNNWIHFDNLFNVPFLLQVGAGDGAYERNRNAVQNHLNINQLQAERGGYVHDMFLHHRGSHNSWRDNDSQGRPQTLITNFSEWLSGAPAVTSQRDTNAIHWMKNYQRNSYPSQLYWDYQVNAPRNYIAGQKYLGSVNQALLTPPKNLFYWLSIVEGEQIPNQVVRANIDGSKNQISLSQFDHISRIRILLRNGMVDFSKPVQVKIDGKDVASVSLRPNIQTMTRTLLERGDRSYLFHSEIELKKSGQTWDLVQ